ncbi:MAG: aminoglycoside adenylyltransferase family protein [Candidatus Dojkabacteria bacterium]
MEKLQLDSKTKQQINQCIDLIKNVLGEDLLGIYVYGSLVVGGLQKFSDIDLFVVSNRSTTVEEKSKLASDMLSISGIYMKSEKRPIEMIIVVKSKVNPWHYPPTFDFKYGDWLRKDFEAGKIEPWESKEMADLAILITQVLLASETLYGSTPNELLDTVPYSDFILAMTKEIDTLMADLAQDTRNVLLTFARIWSTVVTDTIRSKPEAAVWVIDRLPRNYQPVMQRALAICVGEKEEDWEDLSQSIQPCAEFIVNEIKKEVNLIRSSNNTSRSIRF